jgi:RimJ/RimL family protein N-acetyltransferase
MPPPDQATWPVPEICLETDRLILRSWRESDIDDFLAVNADPRVVATLGPVMDRDQVSALIARMQAHEGEHGHCMWAMVLRESARVIGWCGAIRGRFEPIDGLIEIGWRMAYEHWGKGLVSEGARATVFWLFANRSDRSLWAITSTGNNRSRAVMERLGMVRRRDLDFDHPLMAPDNPLLRHVTYELARSTWAAT